MAMTNPDLQDGELRYSRSRGSDDDALKSFLVKEKQAKINWKKVLPAVTITVSMLILLVSLILIGMAFKRKDKPERYSKEAKRTGLIEFFDKMHKLGAQQNKYFDPRPEKLKETTDLAYELLEELNDKDIDESKLKLREKRAINQAQFYLTYAFGKPYDANYYVGDWMMGPNAFCWQDVCIIMTGVQNLLRGNKPYNKNMDQIKDDLIKQGQGVDQYIENMKLGVKAGMVRSKEECEAALTTLKTVFLNISLYNEKGVLLDPVIKDSEDLPRGVKDYLVEYIGKPLLRLLKYIQNDHILNCVPTDVSSGLGNLPVDYVYVNGRPDKSRPTTKKLPTGEPLSGKKSYDKILQFFTTEDDMDAEKYYKMGEALLKKHYAEMVEFAVNYTGKNDNESAVQEMKEQIKSPDQFFATNLPVSESNSDAHGKCVSEETAMKHCPERWKAFSKWMAYAREVAHLIESKLTSLFYFTSKHQSTPSCPVKVGLDFNPAMAAQAYYPGSRECESPPKYVLPFWMDKPGPKFFEWLINAHETFPGHHLQFQGYLENFQDVEDDAITKLDTLVFIIPVIEGWANYAFYPVLFEDTDLFKSHPDGKFNAFAVYNEKVWGAVRFMIDAGFHYHGRPRQWGLNMLEEFAWMTGDFAEKEVTRYQSVPGQGLAYTIGQTHIRNLREYVKENLGEKFNLKDFHFQILQQGSVTIGYLTKHIKKYVQCMKDKSEDGCDKIFDTTAERNYDAQKKPPITDKPSPYRYVMRSP